MIDGVTYLRQFVLSWRPALLGIVQFAWSMVLSRNMLGGLGVVRYIKSSRVFVHKVS